MYPRRSIFLFDDRVTSCKRGLDLLQVATLFFFLEIAFFSDDFGGIRFNCPVRRNHVGQDFVLHDERPNRILSNFGSGGSDCGDGRTRKTVLFNGCFDDGANTRNTRRCG